MKSPLIHRVSTLLAATLATAALATGVATAAPLTLDPLTPTDPAPIAADGTGSASSGSGQITCKMQGGTWVEGDSTHVSYCRVGFQPSTHTIDLALLAAQPVATTTGSGWSASSSVPYLNSALCQFLGQGRYWRADRGCTDVPPFVD
ncbi:hypothetical protein [Nocardia sp. NPDC005825]|uniref:hypothetical protein n=1 Tax=unclassified Nocardia TaxID=2637762 RepID=UPI0033E2A590